MKGLEAVLQNIELQKQLILKAVEMHAHKTAAKMERYAKENKKWKKRTGDAEGNLRGAVVVKKRKITAQIRQDLYGATGEEYGYWLENSEKFEGKYSILKETANAHSGYFFDGLADTIDQELKG